MPEIAGHIRERSSKHSGVKLQQKCLKEKKDAYGRVVKAVCRIIGVPDIPMGPDMILCVSILSGCCAELRPPILGCVAVAAAAATVDGSCSGDE